MIYSIDYKSRIKSEFRITFLCTICKWSNVKTTEQKNNKTKKPLLIIKAHISKINMRVGRDGLRLSRIIFFYFFLYIIFSASFSFNFIFVFIILLRKIWRQKNCIIKKIQKGIRKTFIKSKSEYEQNINKYIKIHKIQAHTFICFYSPLISYVFLERQREILCCVVSVTNKKYLMHWYRSVVVIIIVVWKNNNNNNEKIKRYSIMKIMKWIEK